MRRRHRREVREEKRREEKKIDVTYMYGALLIV
jgi:hypothetical protein